jgi:hypothetical protein
MFPKRGELLPGPAGIGRPKERRVFHAGVDRIGIGERGLQVPHPGELPWVLGAVVPLMGAGVSIVAELVPGGLPALPSVARSLNHLAEPAAGLRGVETVGIGR